MPESLRRFLCARCRAVAFICALQDVDMDEGILTVHQSKFKKSRLVPLHPSTVKVLRGYREQRLRESAETGPDAPFFISRRRRRFNRRTLLGTIQTLAQR